MPSALPQHKPHSVLRDDRVRRQDYARHAARALPYSGKRWQAIRKMVLDRDPLCRACGEPSTDVDHADGNNANNLLGNLQGLCHSCHSRKTRREMNEKSRGAEPRSTALPASHAHPRIGAG